MNVNGRAWPGPLFVMEFPGPARLAGSPIGSKLVLVYYVPAAKTIVVNFEDMTVPLSVGCLRDNGHILKISAKNCCITARWSLHVHVRSH
jgi:hypothetical protein